MYIIMSFNSKFMLPACTTIYTLFLYNNDVELHIGYQDLSVNEMRCIKRFEKLGINNSINFIKLENELDAKLNVVTGRWTAYMFNKFYIPKYLSDDVGRCLWLDSDLMIRGGIRELYELDFEENYFGGACENTSNPLERLGFEDYINVGVLLMNLYKIREDNAFDELWKFILDPSFDYGLPEQDAVNIVFRGKIKFVPMPIWNRLPLFVHETVEENPDFELAEKARIVHFLSKQKPWLEKYAEVWDYGAQKFPVAGKFRDEYLVYLEQAMDFLEEHA